MTTYIIAHDGDADIPPAIWEMTCTYRELLEYLAGINDENRNDEWDVEEDGQPITIGELPDEKLVEAYREYNLDGGPVRIVYDLDAHKQILPPPGEYL